MSGNSGKSKVEPIKTPDAPETANKTCFVIMPIADHPDYPDGHFARVYDHIIKPACHKAGFIPDRADDAQHTHVIMMNILQRILDADIALCDLSSKNPNVMYELGIRQAFDKPVTLIKDEKTDRVFDTGMLSDVEYSSNLRVDNVQVAIDAIAQRLKNTYDKKDEQVSSLIQLMKVEPARPPSRTVVSADTNVVLEAIATLGRRITALEPRQSMNPRSSLSHNVRNELMSTLRDLQQRLTLLSMKRSEMEAGMKSLKESSKGDLTDEMHDYIDSQITENELSLREIDQQIAVINAKLSSNYNSTIIG